jgi:ligand-binding sensor domain-containing protein
LSRLFACIILLVCFTGAHGQAPSYLFTELSTKEGLAQVTVNFVQQDAKGFIWLGGNSIVQRYDGHRFQNFYVGKNRKIPGTNLQGMHYDSVTNRLWLLTGNKELGYLDADNLSYHAVKIVTPPGYENKWFALQVNKKGGVILIYVDSGITTFNEQANEVAAKYNSFSLPTGWEPRHVWQDEFENYWIGTKNGLLKYNGKKKLLSYRGHNEENDPVINQFANKAQPAFIYTYDSMHWVYFDAGAGRQIYSYDTNTGTLKEWHPVIRKALREKYHSLYGVVQFKDGTTWFSGAGILARVDYQQHSLTFIKAEASGANSIRYDDIYNMYQDREKSNWICTNKGLFRFNPSAHVFNTVNNVAENDNKEYDHSVTGFLETSDGEILVSTWGAGVFSYNSTFNPIASKYIQRNKPVDMSMAWCLLQKKNGDIWQGHQAGKLGIYNAATKKTSWLYPEPANKRTIRQLAEDKDGNVWMGTHGGQLVKWDVATNQFKLAYQLKRLISRLYFDTKNNLWVCTDNDGVYCINTTDEKIVRHYTEDGAPGKRLLTNGASDILQYDDTTMVISSNGLSILNTNTETVKYLDEGTPITSMVLDKKKNLWFTFNTGIACRQLQNEALIYTFDARDGIGNTEFQVGAATVLRNGNIAFGTSHDMVVFDPAVPVNFTIGKPVVQVSGVFLGDKQLPVDSVLRLKALALAHNQNSLSFHFTNNQFQNLQNIHYRVEGLDEDWKKLPANGEVNLNYLPPGKYILKATCMDASLQPGHITSIPITVAPPFYKTWWFYSLVALAMGGLLFWIDAERMKRKNALLNMRSNIANNLNQEVHTVLNNINILSEMAKMKSDTDPRKSKEFIEQIQHKSHNMIIAMDDMLWAIAPENDSMEKTVDRLREYIESLNNRHGAGIRLLVDEPVMKLDLNMQVRHEAFILFKESILSLVKAGAPNCNIHIALEKPQLAYTIQFSADGCDAQQLNHLQQRQDISHRLEAINARLNIDLRKSVSVLELKVPV